ncbi:hypothetical protein AURDEDRAFT_70665 [Auricularia subglabra TFB-10046 SS5]|nr:hypothetical protein AURDEDRAFT_70665 [Auricularia subglabra TFB-10046 SS5]
MKSTPKLLEHNSAHILHDKKLRGKSHLCGFCLRNGLCHFWLTTTHGKTQLDLKNSICGKKPPRLSYTPATQSSPNSPCTNIPVQCPKCSERDEAIFKYNLAAHFREKHADLDVSDYEKLWVLSHEERAGMSQVWKRIVNARTKKNAKQKEAVPDLRISDAHMVTSDWRCVATHCCHL